MSRAHAGAWGVLTVWVTLTVTQAATAQPALPPSLQQARASGEGTPARGLNTGRLVEIQVELAWLADPLLCTYYPSSRAVGGTLEVGGWLPSEALRTHALRLAGQNCNLQIVDRLKVDTRLNAARVPALPDELKRSALIAIAADYPAFAPRIQVACQPGGRITISGPVDSLENKLKLSQRLRRLPGCTQVVNYLDAGKGAAKFTPVIIPRDPSAPPIPRPVPAVASTGNSQPSVSPYSPLGANSYRPNVQADASVAPLPSVPWPPPVTFAPPPPKVAAFPPVPGPALAPAPPVNTVKVQPSSSPYVSSVTTSYRPSVPTDASLDALPMVPPLPNVPAFPAASGPALAPAPPVNTVNVQPSSSPYVPSVATSYRPTVRPDVSVAPLPTVPLPPPATYAPPLPKVAPPPVVVSQRVAPKNELGEPYITEGAVSPATPLRDADSVVGTVPPQVQAQLCQRVKTACPEARDVEVLFSADNEALVRLRAPNVDAARRLGLRIRSLPELRPYRPAVEITYDP